MEVSKDFRRSDFEVLGGILGAEKICGELSPVLIRTIGENEWSGLVLVTKFIV
jgi:hypothetical protein